MRGVANAINDLKGKITYYGFMFGTTRQADWYRKLKYARSGLVMAKREFRQLQKIHDKEVNGYESQTA